MGVRRNRQLTSLAAVAVVGATLALGGATLTAAPRTCFGRAPTIVATGPDRVTLGTSGPDVIVGTSGADDIRGRGGNDRICSGRGADTVRGGKGDDRINLGSGDDVGRGGSGDDVIKGKKGRDRLYGNRGRDTLRGGSSADRIFGGKGRDALFGNSGDDLLRGNGGADRLTGGSGSDRCFGGSGSDSGSSCETRSSLTPPAPTPKPVGFSPGTYLVGPTTLPSGRYSATAESGCYWERLSGLSGESSDRISNDFLSFAGPLIVDIDPTDVAFTFRSKCGNFSSYVSPSVVAPSIAPGARVVGADILAGLYRGDALDRCYWERLNGFGGQSADRITNDLYGFAGQVVVEIEASDIGFYLNDKCGTLTRYTAPASPASSFGPGTHVVGSDIVPGIYTAQAQANCYWERLSGFNGSSEDRITNDFISSAGQVIVEISVGDAGFFADGECGSWTR